MNLVTNEGWAHADHVRQLARCQRRAGAGEQVFQDSWSARFPWRLRGRVGYGRRDALNRGMGTHAAPLQ
jgi:hypothetical protein